MPRDLTDGTISENSLISIENKSILDQVIAWNRANYELLSKSMVIKSTGKEIQPKVCLSLSYHDMEANHLYFALSNVEILPLDVTTLHVYILSAEQTFYIYRMLPNLTAMQGG